MMPATLKSKVSSLHLQLLEVINILAMSAIACRQALRGALAAGWEKEGELALTMLIGRDDISNDVITRGRYFSMFAYIHAGFRFVLIGRILTAQSTGSHRGIGSGIQFPETE